jgi:hypothetical protein
MDIHFLYPSGNPTALVYYRPNNTNQKYFIGKKIIELYPKIEQVGFVYKENEQYTLEMVWSELCINATLCSFFLLNKIYTKKINTLYLKGPDQFVEGGILANGKTKTSFALPQNNISIWSHAPEQLDRVDFPWITHFYLKKYTQDFDNISFSLLNLFKDTLEVWAIGINQFQKKGDIIKLDTYVMVKDAGTIIKETACWSGCLWLTSISLPEKVNEIDLNILQASWEIVETHWKMHDNNELSLDIINNVHYIWKIWYLRLCEYPIDLSMPYTSIRQVRL